MEVGDFWCFGVKKMRLRAGFLMEFSENRCFLINFALFERFDEKTGRNDCKVRSGDQKWYFFTFGSKSLKSDNLTFFQI